MKKVFFILLGSILTAAVLPAQKRLVADASATVIDWKGDKKVGSEHVGTIDLKSGWVTVEGNAITGGEFVVDMSSIKNIDVKDERMRERLVGHLKSDDFFGVVKFPLSKLVITGSSRAADGKLLVRGNLTIKEATHPVEFTATESKSGEVITYMAPISFDRSLYDVRFGSGKFFSNLGDNAINDEIKLNVKLVVK
ncbi:MAG: YceI family protein [Bacteroidales bacterium]|jgi:polyisoprenoid-binding protein YceI|nr:YceI family protein [Bacteroidales bacterium]